MYAFNFAVEDQAFGKEQPIVRDVFILILLWPFCFPFNLFTSIADAKSRGMKLMQLLFFPFTEESDEPMHVYVYGTNAEGVAKGKELAESLLKTV